MSPPHESLAAAMIVHHDWNAAMPCKHSCSACFSVMLLACEDDTPGEQVLRAG